MEMVCGLDCGKDFLGAALSRRNERLRVQNDPAGFAQLSAWLRERQVTRVGIEASGGYERAVCRALAETGIKALVLDPARVRHFAKAAGRCAKNDPIDAAIIAAFLAAIPETDSVGISSAFHDLAGLLKARRLLVRQHAGLIKAMALAPEAARAALADAGKGLERVIGEISGKIRRAADGDKILRRRVEALRSAPGGGEVTGDHFGVDGVISVPRSAFMDALKDFQAEQVPTTPSPRDPSAVLARAAEIARQRFEQRQAEGKAPFDVIEGTK